MKNQPLLANDVKRYLVFFVSILVLSFPIAGTMVFVFGVDREFAASVLSFSYVGVMFGLLLLAWLPIKGLKDKTSTDRLELMVLIWLFITYGTALCWELPWLILHDAIASARDEIWAYTWWAYIDGGDERYANPTPLLLAMETLSSIKGIVGMTALSIYLRSGRVNNGCVIVFMLLAMVDLYSTNIYYANEIFAGFPSVDTTQFVNLWVKFVLANCFWLIVPWIVIVWGVRKLNRAVNQISDFGNSEHAQ